MIFCGLYNNSWMSFHRFLFYLSCSFLLTLHFTVAWYKIFDVKHDPFIVQSSLTSSCIICVALWAWVVGVFFFFVIVYFWSDVRHARITSFYYVYAENFTNLLWKYLLINLMNILPIMVLADFLYDGLNNIHCSNSWALLETLLNIEKVNFSNSIKNIPTTNEKSYKLQLI